LHPIAVAVPAFVVVEDAGEDLLHGRDIVEDFESDFGVALDLGEFVVGEAAHFAEGRFGDADLADVVQEAGDAVLLDGFAIHSHRGGHFGGEEGDAIGMAAGVRVLGVDGGGEAMDRADELSAQVGEAGHVFVKDADEIRGGAQKLGFFAGDVLIIALLVAGQEVADVVRSTVPVCMGEFRWR
jgi:hypothetical protein